MLEDFKAQADSILEGVTTSAPNVPGVVAMLTDRQNTIYQGAAGYSDIAKGTPASTNDVFALFSMTKANRTISEFKKKAVPCEKKTWDNILKSDKPISQHAGLLRSLRDQMAVMDAAAGEYRGTSRKID